MKLLQRAAWAAVVGTSCTAILSCGSSPPPVSGAPVPGGPSAPPQSPAAATVAPKAQERDAQRRVADFLARVGSVRHLRPRANVEARELDRPALIASVRQHVAREIPPDVIRNQGELLVGLGLVPPAFDYEEGAFRLLEAQLAGFYEPHDKKMYLAADLPERAADATLAHELVHALQDQHFDLGSRLAYKPEANDRESALQALAEGDATSAMMDLLLTEKGQRAIDVMDDDVFAAQVEGSMTESPDVAGVPRVLRASLVAPYVDGVLFVHALRRRGIQRALASGSGVNDGGWSAVDGAWRTPPESTEQMLHLAKYDAREPPESVPVPPPPGPGFTVAYDDVFGEEGLRIAVEEWVPKKSAAAAAKGWGGDRAALFRGEVASAPAGGRAAPVGTLTGTPLAAAWHIRFDPGDKDPDSEAREAYRLVAEAIRPGQSATSAVCVERPTLGPLSVSRTGRDMVIVAGPYRRDGNRVASDSVCTKSLRWAADVLAKSHRQVAGK